MEYMDLEAVIYDPGSWCMIRSPLSEGWYPPWSIIHVYVDGRLASLDIVFDTGTLCIFLSSKQVCATLPPFVDHGPTHVTLE